jgi:phage gpG-like protein
VAPITRAARPGLGFGNAPGQMVSIDWSPTPVILAASYETLGVMVRSFREPLKRSVQQVMAPSIRKNFDVEGRPPWQALSDVTIDIRAREGFSSGPILTRTGRLKKVAGQLNIWTIDTEKAFVSDLRNASYGIVHQGGAQFASRMGGSSGLSELARTAMRSKRNTGGGIKQIPERPFLLIQEEDIDKIELVFVVWFAERCAAVGFIPGAL